MTVEELLEALQQLPLTAYVAVRTRRDEAGVSIDRVTYAGGEAVIYLEEDDEEDDEDDSWDDDDDTLDTKALE